MAWMSEETFRKRPYHGEPIMGFDERKSRKQGMNYFEVLDMINACLVDGASDCYVDNMPIQRAVKDVRDKLVNETNTRSNNDSVLSQRIGKLETGSVTNSEYNTFKANVYDFAYLFVTGYYKGRVHFENGVSNQTINLNEYRNNAGYQLNNNMFRNEYGDFTIAIVNTADPKTPAVVNILDSSNMSAFQYQLHLVGSSYTGDIPVRIFFIQRQR